MGGIANTLEDRKKIQNNLDRLEHWAENKTVKFKEKCKVLHLGKRNQIQSYKIGDTWLSNTTNKKGLGIVIDHKMNMSQQCHVATKTANTILACVSRRIISKSCEILVLQSTLP